MFGRDSGRDNLRDCVGVFGFVTANFGFGGVWFVVFTFGFSGFDTVCLLVLDLHLDAGCLIVWFGLLDCFVF